MQRRSRSSKHRPNLQRRARLSLEHRFAIIEDDYDHEFHYEGKPVLPIASGTARGNVVYVASMANLLTPGLGTAFVLAPPPVLQRLTALRAACDAQGTRRWNARSPNCSRTANCVRRMRRLP